jgi:hypothetical protein
VPAKVRYASMRDAIKKTERPMFLQIVSKDSKKDKLAKWGHEVADSISVTDAADDSWASVEFVFKDALEESSQSFVDLGPIELGSLSIA